jgi:dihydroflavonol-4-reductase
VNRRVLITGGTGFVGSHTVEAFLAGGWTVRALIRNPARTTWLIGLPVEFAIGTLDDGDSLRAAVKDCAAVVHCAGLTKALRTEDLFRVNAQSVKDFAIVARDAGVKRFVLCSSQAAAGPSRDNVPITENDEPHPLSAYGHSKLEGEKLLRENAGGMEWVILRPPSVMGPRDEQFLPLFRAVAKFGIYPQFGGGSQRYSFVSVFDLARALRTAAETVNGVNEVYFVASQQALNWQETAGIIARESKRRTHAIRFCRSFLQALGFISETIASIRRKPALLSRDKLREILAPGWVCSSEKIKRNWNFQCEWTAERMILETFTAYRKANRL